MATISGADCIGIQNNEGQTALDLAFQFGNEAEACVILEQMLDINEENSRKYFEQSMENKFFVFLPNFIRKANKNALIRFLDENTKEKKYSILWHLCKDGHLDSVKEIMEFYPELIHIDGPDGTSPHLMAYMKGHQSVIDYLKDKFNLNITYEETKCNAMDSFMINLTRKCPVYNENVEKKFSFKIVSPLHVRNDVFPHLLPHFCIFRPIRSTPKDSGILYIKTVNLKPCVDKCTRYVLQGISKPVQKVVSG